MAESSSSSSFQAISTLNNNNIQPPLYDVFVSFRGEDVRKGFVSHLQAAFKRKGIATFFDEELKRGREISPDLLKAIQQSSISIVVFSENYASSTWCLNELLKILECRNMVGQKIMPVFYHVDPSNVRKQTGSYAEAFTRHEKTLEHGKHVIQKWRAALKEIANLSGFDSANWRLESGMIDKITQEILKKLDRLTLDDVDRLVGIGGRVERILEKLFADGSKDDVRILGIWGMGGIGKTTVARTLFHKIKNKFDGYCFLENVRENSGKNGHGLPDLRNKLLSQVTQEERLIPMDISRPFLKNRLCGKKVLIVLDDIDDREQLDNLAGGHDWFGVGSRIVITTRKRQLLTDANEVYNYATEQLSDEEALHLFSHHAFKTSHPPKVYLEFSRKAINYACGNPLALKLLGSYLRKKDEKTWESALARLERFSDDEIVKRVLELSFEGLDSNQKNILLDVACFLKGDDVEFATSLWDVCGFYPQDSISVLCDNCLMSLRYNSELWMHDLIQEMCKAKVRKESTEPGEHSRLWEPKDIFHVFNKNTGTSKIECIILNLSETNEVLELGEEAFVKMEKLRFLKFFSRELNQISTKIRLPRGLAMLPDSLTYLCWDRYPNKFLASKFDAQNLVGLSLRQSCIKQLLNGGSWRNLTILKLDWMFRHSSICSKRLKSLDLSGCSEFSNLSAISDNMEHLHELSLEGNGVSNLPPSIENLTGLVKLNLSNCKNLASLPDSICNLKRLGRLVVSGCKSLQHLPENIGNLESLCVLLADRTSIKYVPASIVCLKNLCELSFRGCRGIKPSTFHDYWLSYGLLPRSSIYTTSCMGLQLPPFGGWQKLWQLNLSYCNLLEAPRGLHNLTSLRSLDLSGNYFETLPQTIFSNLSSLTRLKLNHCTRLRSLPELPPSLSILDAVQCTSLESFMNFLNMFRGIGKRGRTGLNFGNCFKLKNQCNYIMKSMAKEFYLAEKAAQNLYNRDLNHRAVVTLPGSEIPEWFNNQTVGNTLTFALPPHCSDISLGFAVCLNVSPNHPNLGSFFGFFLHFIFRDTDKKTYDYFPEFVGVQGNFSFKGNLVFFGIISPCGQYWPNNSNQIECSVRHDTGFSNGDHVKVKNFALRLVNKEKKTQPSFNSSS